MSEDIRVFLRIVGFTWWAISVAMLVPIAWGLIEMRALRAEFQRNNDEYHKAMQEINERQVIQMAKKGKGKGKGY